MSFELSELSCVIPVSNFQNNKVNLFQALRLASTYRLEIILVLDTLSISDTQNIKDEVSKIQSKSNFIILEGSFGNPGGPRNQGLKHATRNLVTFWDCDDLPNFRGIAEAIAQSDENNFDLLIGSFIRVETDNRKVVDINLKSGLSIEEAVAEDFFKNPGIWRIIFRRNFVLGLNFPEIRCGEDQVFIEHALNLGAKIQVSPLIFYSYQVGNAWSISKSTLARKDLSAALSLGRSIVGVRESKNAEIILLMILRQHLSIIRQNRNLHKFRALFQTLRYMLSSRLFTFRILKLLVGEKI